MKTKTINWNYISGFFDADGSITLCNTGKSKQKTIQMSFHNTELNILNEIQQYILQEIGCKGFISLKPAKKETHKDSYDLKYTYLTKTLLILKNMFLLHPKKIHRKIIAFKLQKFTPRNGKYTKEMLLKRKELEQIFFNGTSESPMLH